MELGLSLGGKSSKTFHGITGKAHDDFTKTAAAAQTFTSAAGECSLGFCMALTINSLNGTNQKLSDDGYIKEEDGQNISDDQETSRESRKIEAIIDGRQKILKLNPHLHLDLLPPSPVDRNDPLPWFSDNGSSHGGSSVNVLPARGLDVTNSPPTAAGIEEATSSLRLNFYSYHRTSNVLGKKDLELRNDAVDMERPSSRASDEDDYGIYRKKLRLTKQQSAYLEESFKDNSILNPKQKLELAKQLSLSPRQVEVWFQNRRARTKLKQTEMDYEYLKKCREELAGENRRLCKEVQELRALKTTSNPFNLQLPTTLIMCPSCERVAKTTINTTAVPPNTKLHQSMSTTSRTPFPLSSESRSLMYPFLRAPPSDLS
ncbi:hypothetical protein L1887_37986 [Cichorium endivia]|nr:hypothetical protein L1887_37986 [Cichorium endivia]